MTAYRLIFFLGVSLFLLSRGLAESDLEWTTKEIDTSAGLDRETVESVFHFKNKGTKAVTIFSVSTSCGCTAASPSKKSYEPGEEGEIKAVFTVGGRSGLQEKTIVVESSDVPDTPTTLVLKVSIPEAFTLEPRLLIWVSGVKTKAVEKSSALTVSSGQDLKVSEVLSDDPAFKVRLVTDEPGKRFHVAIIPTSLEKPAKGMVRVKLVDPMGRERTAAVYAVIR